MKSYHIWIISVLLLFAPLASADIIDWSCADDGDGALVVNATWDEGTSTLNVSGAQNWSPGHMLGGFTTDTELDPDVWVVEIVDNQTNFAWTDYHIGIEMTKPFSIIGVVAPPDWTWAITPPAPNGTEWLGTVDYYAGTPIAIGSSGQFGFVISFEGTVQFSTAQYPTGAPVPAPGAVLLGAMGLSFAGWRLRRGTV